MEEAYYIAYLIVPDEIPESGRDMLFFYTKKGDKYYWGTGNNSFSQEFMDNLESKKRVIKLPELIKLEKETEVVLDETGKVYFGTTAENLKCLEGIVLK